MDRFRLLAAFLAIVFVAVLGAMGSVHAVAAPAQPVAAPAQPLGQFTFEEDDEEEGAFEAAFGAEDEIDLEADECEFDDEAREEACEEEVEEREVAEAEAEECRLESAEATVAAVPGRNQLRLTVRYRTFEPSVVAIDLGLRGGKGALDLGSDSAHFGRTGTLHSTQSLTDPQMERAMAAKEFTVAVAALNTPDFCGELFERHLTARASAGSGMVWSDPSSSRRAKASRASRTKS